MVCLVKSCIHRAQGVILDPEKIYFDERTVADEILDCNNAIIAPGYIDIQARIDLSLIISRLF